MGWLEGLLTGYTDQHFEEEKKNRALAEEDARREADIYKTLLSHEDPQIQRLAATGVLQMGAGQKRKSGFAGWMGEMRRAPVYTELEKYYNTPQWKTVPAQPGVTPTGGAIATKPGSAALPATSPVQPGAPPTTPVQPPPRPPQLSFTPNPAGPTAPEQSAQAPGTFGRTPEQIPSIPSQQFPGLMVPPPEPPPDMAVAQDTEGAIRGTAPTVNVTAAAPPPPAPPTPEVLQPPVQPMARQELVYPTYPSPGDVAEEAAVGTARGRGTGDYLADVEMFRRAGHPNPEKAAADYAVSKTMRGNTREGDARQITGQEAIAKGFPDGAWIQDIYDTTTGNIVNTIPAGAKGAGRALNKREEIAASMYLKEGEDPLAVMKRLTAREHLSVLREEGILAAEAKLRSAEMMANAPLSNQAKSELIEQLNGKWLALQKPQREMARALNEMEVGVNRFNQDRLGASQAVLVTFQKILDPTSVVRESEYDRSAAGLSVISRIQGFWDKYGAYFDAQTGRWIGGGAGVPEADLRAMAETARQFAEGMVHFNDDERTRIEDRAAQNHIDPGYIFGGGVKPPPAPPGAGVATTPTTTAAPATAPAAGPGPEWQMINGVLHHNGQPF